MLTKATQIALRAELETLDAKQAALNTQATEIEFARATVLQALGLSDKPGTTAAAVDANGNKIRAKKVLRKENKDQVYKLVIHYIAANNTRNPEPIAAMLAANGIPLSVHATNSLIYRLNKAGLLVTEQAAA